MSLIQMEYHSPVLNMTASISVILPAPRNPHAEIAPLKTLYLLHGMGDNQTSWVRRTGIERYALQKNLAVVMPDGFLSCYENMAHGGRYRDYIADELPAQMRKIFPLSARREDNYIAGCSMGGFGALKLGLAQPERYAAIGSFSTAHMEYRFPSERVRRTLLRVYGDNIDECDRRVAADARRAAQGDNPLRIFHCCGDQDMLRENALKTRAFMDGLAGGAIDYHFEELPGSHDWALWDRSVCRFIEWLGLADAGERQM